ncbi:MAG TPA: acetyl-CoA carboxylase carboxyltransferase subunit alpha [Candidatus Wallbacteria bacterium]|nr:acetyl-CoA carboxylase carboxyltransferase subunit alpha [Candidatus Wallbacteria bacterium]
MSENVYTNLASLEEKLNEIDSQIEKFKKISEEEGIKLSEVVEVLERKKIQLLDGLDAWQKTLIARHKDRPLAVDYISGVFSEFTEMCGDRCFANDAAVIGGMAYIEGRPVVVIGQQKGRTTEEKVLRNFGSPHPEGYRKALRLMKFAEKFKKPIITFVDTQGAYPGIGAEERGQALAIAENLREMSKLRVPIIVVVIGEGGSGGALALAVGDRILMLKYSIYSVISPEGCASILFRDAGKAPLAAAALKLTADDLYSLKVIDEIISEPSGGAHRDHKSTLENVKAAIIKNLDELSNFSDEEIVEKRYQKFRKMGKTISF